MWLAVVHHLVLQLLLPITSRHFLDHWTQGLGDELITLDKEAKELQKQRLAADNAVSAAQEAEREAQQMLQDLLQSEKKGGCLFVPCRIKRIHLPPFPSPLALASTLLHCGGQAEGI